MRPRGKGTRAVATGPTNRQQACITPHAPFDSGKKPVSRLMLRADPVCAKALRAGSAHTDQTPVTAPPDAVRPRAASRCRNSRRMRADGAASWGERQTDSRTARVGPEHDHRSGNIL